MTYKLNPELRKIQSPVVLALNGTVTEYPSGAALTELELPKRYSLTRMTARKNKIVIDLQECPDMPYSSEAWAVHSEEISFF